MEQIQYRVLDSSGAEVGKIDLDPAIFGAEVNSSLVHDVVCWQLSKRRAGTHSVLTKGVMKGGGRKPWRQKGTGRARCGSNTSPIWVGGAVAHGPKPHDYKTRVAKRARKQALISALSDKVHNNMLMVLDDLKLTAGKTSEVRQILERIGVTGQRAILILPDGEGATTPEQRASRNLAKVQTFSPAGVSVLDVVRSRYVVSTVAGMKALQVAVQQRQTAPGEAGK